ncbi:DUF726-domain-containing protein [Gautieria morchelliformis]|nr:DUF726-domain-containing protein [Gautieria morchelliformis]
MADITKLVPSRRDLSEVERLTVFEYFQRRLADHRNLATLYADQDHTHSNSPQKDSQREEFVKEINTWGSALLKQAWAACDEPGSECPELDPLTDTSIVDLPRLPPVHLTAKILNSIIFLHLTSTKSYSAHTRSFLLRTFGDFDEDAVAETLKHPDQATRAAQNAAQKAKKEQADRTKIWRRVGVGAGAVAGGILIGVTGGLAAPLVGAGLSTLLGVLGIGGPIGLLATGLASSGAVCGALFGVYGASSTARMVARHTREIRDFAFVPVHPPRDSLAVRLCISGWLTSPQDVTAPWTIFDQGEDTFALQWEVKALEDLSTALYDLIKLHALNYVKWAILKHTVMRTLMAGLSPLLLLKVGQVVDNPWSNAKALAIKAGRVLGTLLANRAFGNRPITLTGYSLGSLVLVEALKYLSTLPVAETMHLIQDVFLFGTPAPTNPRLWSAIRRTVAGRVVNGYAETDYVLAILSRTTDASWGVAGLHPVEVQGVENVQCDGVEGHLKWRGLVGQCLQISGADGVVSEKVELQLKEVAEPIAREIDQSMEAPDTVETQTG